LTSVPISKIQAILYSSSFSKKQNSMMRKGKILDTFAEVLEREIGVLSLVCIKHINNYVLKSLKNWEIKANFKKMDLVYKSEKISNFQSLSQNILLETLIEQIDICNHNSHKRDKNQKLSTISEDLCDPDISVGVLFGNFGKEGEITMHSARVIDEQLRSTPRSDAKDTLSLDPPLDEIESIGGVRIVPYYINTASRPYCVSQSQLYSNTPTDLEYKVTNFGHFSTHSNSKSLISLNDIFGLTHHILNHCHIIFPVTKWFWENENLQEALENRKVPFLGIGDSNSITKLKKHIWMKLCRSLVTLL
jgi:hypothetical protein